VATSLADAPRALIEWVPRRLRKFLFKPSNKLTKASAKAAHAASLAAQQAHLTSEAHRLKDEAQAALAAAEAASANADSAERAAADAVADAARARAWAAQEVALAHAEAQEHLDAAEASAAKRLVDVYNDAKNSLFAGLGAGQQRHQDHTPTSEILNSEVKGNNVREAPSALQDAESDDSPARAVALGPLPSQPQSPPPPPAVPSDIQPLESARTRLMQAEAAAAEANAAALTARAWAAKEVEAARIDAAAAMKLLMQTKAAHRAYRQQTSASPSTAADPTVGDTGIARGGESVNAGVSPITTGGSSTDVARAALEMQFEAPSAMKTTREEEEEKVMSAGSSEVAHESESNEAVEEEHDATLQRMRRLRKSMQLGDDFQTE